MKENCQKKKGVGTPGRVGKMPVVVAAPVHPGVAAVAGVTSLCHLAAWSRMELRNRPGIFR